MKKRPSILKVFGWFFLISGLALVLFGAFGGFLVIWACVLAGNGVALLLLSYIKWKPRFEVLIYLALIIGMPVTSLFIADRLNQPGTDMFLVPEGFRGWVIILYGQENGQAEEFEKGKRIFRIPANGMLKTKFQVESNFLEYYFTNRGGNRLEIKDEWSVNEKDSTTILLRGGGSGGSDNFSYTSFFIGKLTDEKPDPNRLLDSLEKSKP